jgi:hypothetical protein
VGLATLFKHEDTFESKATQDKTNVYAVFNSMIFYIFASSFLGFYLSQLGDFDSTNMSTIALTREGAVEFQELNVKYPDDDKPMICQFVVDISKYKENSHKILVPEDNYCSNSSIFLPYPSEPMKLDCYDSGNKTQAPFWDSIGHSNEYSGAFHLACMINS